MSTLRKRIEDLEAGALADDDNAPIRWVSIEGYAGDPDFVVQESEAEAEAQRTGARLLVVSKRHWPDGDL